MKKLVLICAYTLVLISGSCNKKQDTDEIKIKRNDPDVKKESTDTVHENVSYTKVPMLQTITSKEVKTHIGDSLNIKGYIADVYLGDKVAYLNFENKFPKNIFSCAIFQGRFEEFGNFSKYRGKNVEVTGKISSYKGKPQVILNSKEQIKIVN